MDEDYLKRLATYKFDPGVPPRNTFGMCPNVRLRDQYVRDLKTLYLLDYQYKNGIGTITAEHGVIELDFQTGETAIKVHLKRETLDKNGITNIYLIFRWLFFNASKGATEEEYFNNITPVYTTRLLHGRVSKLSLVDREYLITPDLEIEGWNPPIVVPEPEPVPVEVEVTPIEVKEEVQVVTKTVIPDRTVPKKVTLVKKPVIDTSKGVPKATKASRTHVKENMDGRIYPKISSYHDDKLNPHQEVGKMGPQRVKMKGSSSFWIT